MINDGRVVFMQVPLRRGGVFFNNLFHSSESAFRTSGLDMYACISIGMYVGVPIG